MLKAIRGIYNSSNQMYFQGKKAELKKKEKEGYRVVGGSNGTYILAQPAEAIILLEDEETIMADAKDEIRRIYNVERVTEKKLNMLVGSIQSEKMEAFYTDEEGLRIEPKAK